MMIEVDDRHLHGVQVTRDRARLELAVGLFASEEITLGQAAALARLPQSEFLHELGRRRIAVHYGVDQLDEDMATLKRLGRRLGE